MDFGGGGGGSLAEALRPAGGLLSGVAFGAGAWLLLDAVVVTKVAGAAVSPVFVAPGLVALFAALLMCCVRRDALDDSDGEGRVVRFLRCLILLASLALSRRRRRRRRASGLPPPTSPPPLARSAAAAARCWRPTSWR